MLSTVIAKTPATSGPGCLVARAERVGVRYGLLPVWARTDATGMPGVAAPIDATRLPAAGLTALAVVAATAGTRVRTAPPVQIDQFHTTLGVSTSRRPLS